MPQFTNGLTANYNNYSAAELEKALESWVSPYPKPIILNHDLNTEPIGRVMAAKMDKEEDGSPYVRLQIAITDPVAAQKVLDKRYLTGSVGGRAGKAVCSISGEDLAAESNGKPMAPKYKRGQVYKGKLAYIDMQDISFKEYSFVNQPADGKSSVRSTTAIADKDGKPSSEGWVAKSTAFVLHMNEEDIYSLEEHESILKNKKKKESKPLYLQVKGAFLTAMSVQENENYNKLEDSLLSNENDTNDAHEENLTMKENVKEEDILATVEELSQDLSALSGSNTEESEDPENGDEDEEEVEESKKDESTVEEADSSSVSAALQKVLNDTIVFYFAAHRAHWNVEGEDFTEFHQLFSAIYEDALDAIDPMAENIRKLQAFPSNLTEAIMNASFKDDCDCTDAMGMSQMLLDKNSMVNASVLAAFNAASTANEQGIANFLADRDDMHKKWSWQLRSSLKMEVEEPENESWKELFRSEEPVAEADEPEDQVDSTADAGSEEDQEAEESEAELSNGNPVAEQEADDTTKKLQSLEDENQKLKNALHRTLVERVVDAKIAAGIESVDNRVSAIEEHATRSAASLADSLRDLAKMPVMKSSRSSSPEIDFEVNAVEGEGNAITVDNENQEVEEQKEPSFEQLFVDALMGRRKL